MIRFSVLCAALAFAAAAQAQTVAITGATVHTMGPQGDLSNATVVLKDGKIAAVGTNVAVPAGATVIDARGKVVTPGFWMVGSSIAITELPSYGKLDETRTHSDALSAAYDIQYGLNPNSVDIGEARAGGITHAVVTPEPGGGANRKDMVFGGEAAIVRMRDDASILGAADVAITLDAGANGGETAGGGRGAEFQLLHGIFEDVRDYAARRSAYENGQMRTLGVSKLDLDALVPVVKGQVPLLIHVDKMADILQVLKLARDEHLRVILQGAQEGWMVAKDIAAAKVPVILNAEDDIPTGSFENLGATLENAARLDKAGVLIAFEPVPARPGYLVRGQRFVVGRLVGRANLPYASALAALTVNPARMFGVADSVGSLQPGFEADVVVWSGDPLEASTAVEAAFINGIPQPVVPRSDRLGQKYLDQLRASGVLAAPNAERPPP